MSYLDRDRQKMIGRELLKHLKSSWLLFFLFVIQIMMTIFFLDQNYFNDDLEPIAGAKYFSDLYLTQLNVHGPGHIMLDWIWFSIFGTTFVSNRALAGFLNLVLIWTFWRISNNFLVNQKARNISTLSAASAWFVFQSQFWGYLNLSQLTVMIEIMLLISICIRSIEGKIVVTSPIFLGILIGIIISTRYLQILQLFFLVIVLFWGLHRKIVVLSFRCLRHITIGFIGYLLFILLLFHDRLSQLINWSLLHNYNLRSGTINWMAWVGDLSIPTNRILVVQIAVLFMLLSIGNLITILNQKLQPSSFFQLILLMAFLGGWIACNPSGLSSTYFQALPAIGPICASVGLRLGSLYESYATLLFRSRKIQIWQLAQITLILALISPSIFPSLRSLISADAQVAIESSRQYSKYIRENSSPKDTVFVFGTNPLIYAEAERKSSTIASILFPDLMKYENEIFSQLVKKRPKFVIFDSKDFFFDSNIESFPKITYFIIKNYQRTGLNGLLELRTSLRFPIRTPVLTESQIGLLNMSGVMVTKGCFLDLEVKAVSKYRSTVGVLSYEKQGDWSELFVDLPALFVTDLTGTEILTIKFDSRINDFFLDKSRFLRLGVWKDNEFMSWIWFRTADNVLSYSVPLNSLLALESKEKSRFRISIGGWGPADSNLEILDLRINDSELLEKC